MGSGEALQFSLLPLEWGANGKRFVVPSFSFQSVRQAYWSRRVSNIGHIAYIFQSFLCPLTLLVFSSSPPFPARLPPYDPPQPAPTRETSKRMAPRWIKKLRRWLSGSNSEEEQAHVRTPALGIRRRSLCALPTEALRFRRSRNQSLDEDIAMAFDMFDTVSQGYVESKRIQPYQSFSLTCPT